MTSKARGFPCISDLVFIRRRTCVFCKGGSCLSVHPLFVLQTILSNFHGHYMMSRKVRQDYMDSYHGVRQTLSNFPEYQSDIGSRYSRVKKAVPLGMPGKLDNQCLSFRWRLVFSTFRWRWVFSTFRYFSTPWWKPLNNTVVVIIVQPALPCPAWLLHLLVGGHRGWPCGAHRHTDIWRRKCCICGTRKGHIQWGIV